MGTEYRIMNNLLSFRSGVADNHPTLGIGVSFKVVQVDAAYAYDNFIGDNAYFVQLKLGW